MALEIEHKYLVADPSYRDMATSSVRIAQGYLCRQPERTVRVRIKGNKGYLTVKGVTRDDTREEYEYEIPVADARRLLSLCEGRILDKTRYIVPFEGMVWEVDEFHGDLAPLVTAEIELEKSTRDYPLPPFVGEDVTGNHKYFNSNL